MTQHVASPAKWQGVLYRLHIILGSLVALTMCEGGPLETDPPIPGGELSLTEYDGGALPFDQGPLPNRFGGWDSDCHLFVSEGFLNLEPDYGVFDLAFEVHRCDGLVLSRPNSTGVYWMEGSVLKFLEPAVVDWEPDDFVFEGRLEGQSVVVTGYADVPLTFSGSLVTHAPRPHPIGGREKPIGAAYALVALEGESLRCASGFLIMEPDYRVFEMGVRQSEPLGGDNCGDFVRRKWFGVYGQIGNEVRFLAPAVAEHGSDVAFSGTIVAGGVNLVDPLGRSLLFVNTGIISDW